MTESDPSGGYPGLIHFRCGHGFAVSEADAGPNVWMVVTDSNRTQQAVTMEPADAVTIAAALTDSAVRAAGPAGGARLLGGVAELTVRRALEALARGDQRQAVGQLRWLLGEG